MSHANAFPRIRRIAKLGLALAAALLLAGPVAGDDRPTELPHDTPGPVPSLDPSYRMTNHRVVLITDQAINPRLVTLDEGQLVAWISYSAVPAMIVFEREVAKAMICHSLVNFSIKDDELRSQLIHAGEFASFCELKPGRYRYKVVRPDTGEAAASARHMLRGEIIVGDAG